MRDFRKQAFAALKAYVERGESAIFLFERNKLDKAERMLMRRKAAFHNFRVADQLAYDQGFDSSRDQQMIEIAQAASRVDNELKQVILDLTADAKRELKQTVRTRQNINRYRSRFKLSPAIEHAV